MQEVIIKGKYVHEDITKGRDCEEGGHYIRKG